MKKLFSLLLKFFIVISAYSQSDNSKYIHNWLERYRTCKSGAVTDNAGYVILYDKNYAVWAGIPQSLVNYLQAEADSGRMIDDVCLTERGSWFCVGDNLQGYGYPTSMYNKMSELLNGGDRITCMSFNDYGEWMVITDRHISASNDDLYKLLIDVKNKYGFIRSVSINNTGTFVVADDGFRSIGKIPDSLDYYLRYQQSFDIRYIKFTSNGSWLVTDGYSAYYYSLQ